SILGFYPVLTDDYAIRLHPTVCSGFNADFDGDMMAVHVPLSKESIEEVKTKMLPHQNLLRPADGSPIVVPNKEMALGCYYLTTLNAHLEDKKDEELRFFSSENEALIAYENKLIETREPVHVRINGVILKTSVGRILFNERLLPELKFINDIVKYSDLKVIVERAIKLYPDDHQVVAGLIDNIKEIGFYGATICAGLSFSVLDCALIDEKKEIVTAAEKNINEIDSNYQQGLITREEKKRLANNLWIDVTEDLANRTWDALDEENPVKLIIKSGGARATRDQLKQLSAMKGLVSDPLGNIIEVPTKSSYREGLSVFEYIINARGARKGLIDTALKTADAGYLSRRLVDVSHDMLIREEDCGTSEGMLIESEGLRGDKFIERIKGRYLAKDITGPKGKVLFKANILLDEKTLEDLVKKEVTKAWVRSPLYCKTEYGCCQKCYGTDWSVGEIAEIGTPVGVLAAQSIGEPGTQLTMRVKHFGGIVMADVTQGLPRVDELFEARTPKTLAPITDIAGKVQLEEDKEKGVYRIKITSSDSSKEERQYILPLNRKLLIKNGQLIGIGQSLCEGSLDVKEVLAIQGLKEAQMYLLNEIQKVYESQGIAINDRHFEVIVRKMSDKVIVESEGDTKFIVGEVASRYRFERENKKILSQGGRPAVGQVSMLGISQAATYSDSWLSSASFQYTTKVLTEASIKGQVDHLLGLKENVIIGRLIPVNAELLDLYYNRKEVPVELSAIPTSEDVATPSDDDAVSREVKEELAEEQMLAVSEGQEI
ncbi:MAG: DNA-directed RNA polymerase subunit beta', partial [Candidatus Roizmanbacteria bacterium]